MLTKITSVIVGDGVGVVGVGGGVGGGVFLRGN